METHPSHLKGLDYAVVQQCMHCGLCLPTCPTYEATRLERHGPRGRIALMRAIADDRLEASRVFGEEMYFCLGCLACMTACPAGVQYDQLFEHARAEVEARRLVDSRWRRWVRGVTVKWLFMDHRRLEWMGRSLRLIQKLGIQEGLRRSGFLRWLPSRWQAWEAMTPEVRGEFSDELIPPLLTPVGTPRCRVALLAGCVQDLIYSDVNRDTAEVLLRNGAEVRTPRSQPCCGSLHVHHGEHEWARTLARKMIDLIPPEEVDAIITNAGGCGSHLKRYGDLLKEDRRYAARARLWDRKVKDIHEWLVETGFDKPVVASMPVPTVVTYHESCHLAHGQRVVQEPRQVLRAIPGLQLTEMAESQWCCGSAGVYNLTQPEMSEQLLDRKLRHIRATGASVVATANPGCLLQLVNGARRRGMPLRVVHPVTLLAAAYRAEYGDG